MSQWSATPSSPSGWASFTIPANNWYGLAAVKAADLVLIVEGEPCADAANGLGLNAAATTWQGGSKSRALKTIDIDPLKGKKVLLWPDNDQPGRDAMAALGARLQGIAAEVELIEKCRKNAAANSP